VDVVVFDFGGVLAEEGFVAGLRHISEANGLDPETFFARAVEIAYASGYVVGKADEATFWTRLARETGIRGTPAELGRELIDRFVFRDWFDPLLERLRRAGVGLALLSDQTNWLDELDRKYRIYARFDRVFVSFHLGLSKRDPEIFPLVARELAAEPGRLLLVDDSEGHVGRARAAGWRAHLYQGREGLLAELAALCPGLTEARNAP